MVKQAALAIEMLRFTAIARCGAKRSLDALVICGPSGVGKGALLSKLFQEFLNDFGYSVSHTTRAPRSGEIPGQHYHFVSHSEMSKLRQSTYAPSSAPQHGEALSEPYFVECCQVHNEWYGTSRGAVEVVRSQNKVTVLELDIQGAEKLKSAQQASVLRVGQSLSLTYHYLFVTAPLSLLEKRIVQRGADTPEKVKVRLATAERELAFVRNHPTFFDSLIENNGELSVAYAQLVNVLRHAGAFGLVNRSSGDKTSVTSKH